MTRLHAQGVMAKVRPSIDYVFLIPVFRLPVFSLALSRCFFRFVSLSCCSFFFFIFFSLTSLFLLPRRMRHQRRYLFARSPSPLVRLPLRLASSCEYHSDPRIRSHRGNRSCQSTRKHRISLFYMRSERSRLFFSQWEDRERPKKETGRKRKFGESTACSSDGTHVCFASRTLCAFTC